MFSFNNGILNIKSRLTMFEGFADLSFLLLLCAVFANNSNRQGYNYFYYFGFFFFVGMTVIKVIYDIKSTGSFVLPSITLWYAVFVLLGFASMLWATFPNNCMNTMSRSIQCLLITFCMAQHYSSKNSFLRCIKIITWTAVYSIVYIMINTPFANWFSGAFGYSATQISPNSAGMIYTVCALISFYFCYYEGKKKYYFVTAMQLMAVIMTSSRKSLLCIVFGIAMLVVLNTKRRHYATRIIVLAGLVVLLFYLIMHVEPLYIAIGRRIETMMTYFSTNRGDNSIALRRMFIRYAKELFFNHVFLGVGLNNFGPNMGRIYNLTTYAHNNYYEILADLGLVGFTVYYSYYVYLAAAVVKIMRNSSRMSRLMITILLSIMICEYGLVSFYSVYMQIFLCCVSLFISAYLNNAEEARVGHTAPIANGKED